MGIFDEDDICREAPGFTSFGWWVLPDGTIVEGEEMGLHGYTAQSWIAECAEELGVAYYQDSYDQAIIDLKRLGGVRVSTFHGGCAMHIDYDAASVASAALKATARLIREQAHLFEEYIFEFENDAPKTAGDRNGIIRDLRRKAAGASRGFELSDVIPLTASASPSP